MLRLRLESVNGLAIVSYAAFLGLPKTIHFAPREKVENLIKKQKTKRDNERAASFQEYKWQEREAAIPEASTESDPDSSLLTSVPSATSSRIHPIRASSSGCWFSFSKMNIDGKCICSR